MKTRIGLMAAAATLAWSTASLSATEIQFWHAMGGALGEKVDEIAGKYNASQSDYVVKPVFKGNYTETMTAAVAAFRAGEQPHIVQVFEVGTASMMAAGGAIKPVTEVMNQAGVAFDQADYLPAVVSYYQTPDGDLLSLPFNSSTPVLWVNNDLLKKAGVERAPTTWDEMFDAGAKLQAAGHACAFSFGWQSWVMIENMSAWHNLPIGTKSNGFDGVDTEFTFNNGTITGLLQRVADAGESGMFKYGGRRGDSLALFTTGECAMWMNSSAYYASIRDQAEFDFGQSMLPYLSDVVSKPQNSIIGGATLWVLRGKDDADYRGVAEFFKYMSRPEIQADWHQSTGYVPITTAAWKLSEEQGFYKSNPGTDTAIKQLSLNTPTANSRGLRFGNFVQIRDIINEEMEAIWSGEKTARKAMDDAKARGDALLRKFEKTN
jgi:sn-glycerol 3-phosphate transport system substrate-binding protein